MKFAMPSYGYVVIVMVSELWVTEFKFLNNSPVEVGVGLISGRFRVGRMWVWTCCRVGLRLVQRRLKVGIM